MPAELDAIVAKALAKDAGQRYNRRRRSPPSCARSARFSTARSDTQEIAAAFNPAQPPRRSTRRWAALLLIVALLAVAAWYERAPIRTLWRKSLGPPPAPVIAIVPFDTDPAQLFFADGLAEDLTTRLGQTPGLKVIGRSATRQYRGREPRDVARELGAGVVLAGSVRPAGDIVKVSLELIDPSDGTAIWSAQYTRDVKDIFAVQAQVAGEVAQALRVTASADASQRPGGVAPGRSARLRALSAGTSRRRRSSSCRRHHILRTGDRDRCRPW